MTEYFIKASFSWLLVFQVHFLGAYLQKKPAWLKQVAKNSCAEIRALQRWCILVQRSLVCSTLVPAKKKLIFPNSFWTIAENKLWDNQIIAYFVKNVTQLFNEFLSLNIICRSTHLNIGSKQTEYCHMTSMPPPFSFQQLFPLLTKVFFLKV